MNFEVNDVVGDPSEWLTISVSGGEMPIGRASAKHANRTAKKSNMFFVNSHLSKNHAKLLFEENIIYLEDSGSTFGTVWNENLLVPHERIAIKQGDRIGFVLNRPSNFIKELTKKAIDKKMISLNYLLNPQFQLHFLVETIDCDEGSLVLSRLKPDSCLANLRKENKALILQVNVDKELVIEKLERNSLQEENKPESPYPVTTHVVDSDDSPVEELYQREFCYKVPLPTPTREIVKVDVDPSNTSNKGFENHTRESSHSNIWEPHNESNQIAKEELKIKDMCDGSDTKLGKSSFQQTREHNSNESEVSDIIDDTDNSQESNIGIFSTAEASKNLCTLSSLAAPPEATPAIFNKAISVMELGSSVKQKENNLEVADLRDFSSNHDLAKEIKDFGDGSNLAHFENSRKLELINNSQVTGVNEDDVLKHDNAEKYLRCDSSDEDYENPEDNHSEGISECEIYDLEDCSSYNSGGSNSFFNRLDDLGDPGNVSNDTSDDNNYAGKSPLLGDIAEKPSINIHESCYQIGSGVEFVTDSILCRSFPSKLNQDCEFVTSKNPMTDDMELLELNPELKNRESAATGDSPSYNNRKRSHDDMEEQNLQQSPNRESQETPTPKKARTKSIMREIGKGLMYITGTLAAIIVYGGYAEKRVDQ